MVFFASDSANFRNCEANSLMSLASTKRVSFVKQTSGRVGVRNCEVRARRIRGRVGTFLNNRRSYIDTVGSRSRAQLMTFIPGGTLRSPVSDVSTLEGHLGLILPGCTVPSGVLLLSRLPVGDGKGVGEILLGGGCLRGIGVDGEGGGLTRLQRLRGPAVARFLSGLLSRRVNSSSGLFTRKVGDLGIMRFISEVHHLKRFLGMQSICRGPAMGRLGGVVVRASGMFVTPGAYVLNQGRFEILPSREQFLDRGVATSRDFIRDITTDIRTGAVVSLRIYTRVLMGGFPRVSCKLSFGNQRRRPRLIGVSRPVVIGAVGLDPASSVRSGVSRALRASTSGLGVGGNPVTILRCFAGHSARLLILIVRR